MEDVRVRGYKGTEEMCRWRKERYRERWKRREEDVERKSGDPGGRKQMH